MKIMKKTKLLLLMACAGLPFAACTDDGQAQSGCFIALKGGVRSIHGMSVFYASFASASEEPSGSSSGSACRMRMFSQAKSSVMSGLM